MVLRVLVDIGHPAHVHLFKHVIWKIESMGGHVCVTTREKDVATSLLSAYNLKYHVVGKYKRLTEKILSFVTTNIKLLHIAQRFNPHVFVSVGSPHAAQVAQIMGRIYMTFVDTEGSIMEKILNSPLSTRIYTPAAFMNNMGRKQVRYNGNHEMAYLSPKYFSPDPTVLSGYQLSPTDTYFVVRTVAWSATHDWQQYGISNLDSIVEHLEKMGKVLVSREAEIGPSPSRIKTRVAPEDMHSLLAFARLYIGEGATMASECAALGTPALYVNTQRCGTIDEEIKAGLVNHFNPTRSSQEEISKRIDNILAKPASHYRMMGRRFLEGRIDVIDFIVNEIVTLARRRFGLQPTSSSVIRNPRVDAPMRSNKQ
jgi:predicted glycosyltransferase